MLQKGEGIYVPKRVIFQMIVASVFINILFLLMGMVIGREDSKWAQEVNEAEDGVPQTVTDESDQSSLIEKEMSIFDREYESSRPEPMPESFIDQAFESEPEPQTVEQKTPEPEVTKPHSETRPQPQEAESELPMRTPGDYYVQVVATRKESSAMQLIAQLRKAGHTGFVDASDGWFRVCVGYFPSQHQANQAKSRIDKEFNVKGWVRQRP